MSNRSAPLERSEDKLRLFDRPTIKPHAEASLKVNTMNGTDELQFQIVNRDCKPLLSSQICKQLGLIKLAEEVTSSVNTIMQETTNYQSPLTKEKILKEYKDVFEGLRHIGAASTFVVDPNQSPVQHIPGRIAVALKKGVKAKVEELESKGIIKKETEPTEWISSMVVVARPEKFEIFLDPHDLNKALWSQKFQMPTLEETLPNLTIAKLFTSVDLKDGIRMVLMRKVVRK